MVTVPSFAKWTADGVISSRRWFGIITVLPSSRIAASEVDVPKSITKNLSASRAGSSKVFLCCFIFNSPIQGSGVPALLYLQGIPALSGYFKYFFTYCPVYDTLLFAISSGVPCAITVPPLSPPSGPMSIM